MKNTWRITMGGSSRRGNARSGARRELGDDETCEGETDWDAKLDDDGVHAPASHHRLHYSANLSSAVLSTNPPPKPTPFAKKKKKKKKPRRQWRKQPTRTLSSFPALKKRTNAMQGGTRKRRIRRVAFFRCRSLSRLGIVFCTFWSREGGGDPERRTEGGAESSLHFWFATLTLLKLHYTFGIYCWACTKTSLTVNGATTWFKNRCQQMNQPNIYKFL